MIAAGRPGITNGASSLHLTPQVMEVLIFIYIVFGIIGIQLFEGLLRQRCHSSVPPYERLSETQVCSRRDGEMVGFHCERAFGANSTCRQTHQLTGEASDAACAVFFLRRRLPSGG